ncbi:MAG: RNA polymerase sigma factor [Gaiellaceae bacterium]
MRSDAKLLSAAKTDAHAFRELYERYAERVHGFHLSRTRDYEAALDLTAETFAQAWLSRSRFQDRANGSAAPWLFAIARNVLVTSVRRNRLERVARERLGLLEARWREPEPDNRWLAGLDEALAALSDGELEALQLRIVEELSYDELGRRTGTTAGAARVRVHRGLVALRQRLLNPKEALR